MKITLKIPDTTICAFFSYVVDEENEMIMANRLLSTDDLRSGETIACTTENPTEKGGAE